DRQRLGVRVTVVVTAAGHHGGDAGRGEQGDQGQAGGRNGASNAPAAGIFPDHQVTPRVSGVRMTPPAPTACRRAYQAQAASNRSRAVARFSRASTTARTAIAHMRSARRANVTRRPHRAFVARLCSGDNATLSVYSTSGCSGRARPPGGRASGAQGAQLGERPSPLGAPPNSTAALE